MDFPFSFLKAPDEPLGFGSIVFCKVLDLNRQFNSMTGYEIPCYSFDILDPAFFFISFFGESGTTVSDWTHLSNCFRECEFLFSNCVLNSQLQRMDLGSTCA